MGLRCVHCPDKAMAYLRHTPIDCKTSCNGLIAAPPAVAAGKHGGSTRHVLECRARALTQVDQRWSTGPDTFEGWGRANPGAWAKTGHETAAAARNRSAAAGWSSRQGRAEAGWGGRSPRLRRSRYYGAPTRPVPWKAAQSSGKKFLTDFDGSWTRSSPSASTTWYRGPEFPSACRSTSSCPEPGLRLTLEGKREQSRGLVRARSTLISCACG